MNRRLYLIAAVALAVIASVSVYIATKVSPADIANNTDLTVLADSVPSVVGAKGWINSPALGPADLRGKVVLYDFWTYSCVNCQRTLPHLKALYDRYKDDGLVIVGIHSPEFDFEKDHGNVERAVMRYGVTWPVALDDDMTIWNEFANQAWPAEYLTDRDGRLRQVRFGEGDYDTKENDVRTLLGVPSGAPRAATAGADEIQSAAITQEIHFGLGFGGAQLTSSHEPLTKGTRGYTLPAPVPQDTFALQGAWSVTDQGVAPAEPGAALVLRYRGAEVNLVAGASAAPVPVAVELDGAPLTTIAVGDHDLYSVVAAGPSGYHTLTFTPQGSTAVELYAFTFGAGTK